MSRTQRESLFEPRGREASVRGFARGFSLVEVAIALGVVSASLIPVLGLLAIGFGTMRDANAEMRTALIAQKESAALQMIPFSKLSSLSLSNNYYDIEGLPVAQGEAVFIVARSLSLTNAFVQSASSARLEVRVSGPGVQNRTNTYGFTIGNLGD